jgi:AcrR family transcriptional regulator
MKVRIPSQERSKETKARIMDAALGLFAEKGYFNTNSKEIAKEAGIATGSFYAYFTDKRDLFIEVLKKFYELTEAGVLDQPIDTQADKKELIAGMIHTVFHSHELCPEFDREIIMMSYADDEVREIIESYWRKAINNIKLLIMKFNKQIRVHDIDTAAVIICAMLENTLHRTRFLCNEIDEQRYINELTDMIYQYLFGKGND